MAKYWKIEVRDGFELLYERIVLRGQMSDSKVEDLLKALVCKYGLEDDEIVNCYAKKRTKIKENKLNINRSDAKIITCGTNPYAVATAIEKAPSSYEKR